MEPAGQKGRVGINMSDWLQTLDKAILRVMLTMVSGLFIVSIGVIIGVINKKVSKDAFIEHKDSLDKQFLNVNNHLKEIKEDVKNLLTR